MWRRCRIAGGCFGSVTGVLVAPVSQGFEALWLRDTYFQVPVALIAGYCAGTVVTGAAP